MTKTRIRIEPLMVDKTSCNMTHCIGRIVNNRKSNQKSRGILSLERVSTRKFKEMAHNGFAYIMDYPHNLY